MKNRVPEHDFHVQKAVFCEGFPLISVLGFTQFRLISLRNFRKFAYFPNFRIGPPHPPGGVHEHKNPKSSGNLKEISPMRCILFGTLTENAFMLFFVSYMSAEVHRFSVFYDMVW